jgi:hypothetical protein
LKIARVEERVCVIGRLPLGDDRERVRSSLSAKSRPRPQPAELRIRSTISSTALSISGRLCGWARKLIQATTIVVTSATLCC